MQQLGGRADADEFAEGGAEVGDEEGDDDERGHADAEVLTYEVAEPHAGGGADARAHLLHDKQRDDDDDHDPEELVPVAGAGGGVGGDAAGVVTGVGGDQPRAEDAEQQEEAREAQRAARRPAGPVGLRLRAGDRLLRTYVRNDCRPCSLVSRQNCGCALASTILSVRHRAHRRP